MKCFYKPIREVAYEWVVHDKCRPNCFLCENIVSINALLFIYNKALSLGIAIIVLLLIGNI